VAGVSRITLVSGDKLYQILMVFKHFSKHYSCHVQGECTGHSKSRFTEKSDIKTTYLLCIVLQKLLKTFAILSDRLSTTFSYTINNGGA
jgi:hypothetical protein